MNKFQSILLGAATCIGLHASAVEPDEKYIRSHLEFLASDLMEGRDTGSRGHEIASLYIATEFAKYGLEPAGTEGYMQRVEFRKASLVQSSPKLMLKTAQGTVNFDYPRDYLTSGDSLRKETRLSGEMVFVGYGIIADELGHNDYANIDVNGKVVVMLAGKPKSFPSEEGAHLASGREKARYAAENGAIGIISITTPTTEKIRPYQSRLNYIHTPSLRWLDDQGNPSGGFPSLKGSAFLSQPAAEKLFADAPLSLAQVYEQLEQDRAPKGFMLNGTINLSKQSEHSVITSPNVAGILRGSDPDLQNEYILFTAHSDHTGIAKSVKEDRINNGAMDNASGTSILLETARMFSDMEDRPKRSILFLAVTGEEKGLLGADYFAHNPTVPHKQLVANVNLDMPLLLYNFADVIAFGAQHSDMQQTVEAAVANVGVSLTPDPWPEQALFTRSDHYAFVKQGIPSIFLVTGLTSMDEEEDAANAFNNFLSTHYHKPTDDLNLPINWQAAVRFAQVNFSIGLELANQKNRSEWDDESFFKRFAD